ncbi:1-deoxy-D-xylulose-5-phosphate reductoisomerase [Pseudalkalibacillus caeni]|uniref:1-deoxy-D-xylulose 5-phosphate reductoisomerase n=1 Tax=Exobacillus caeni TaxID=2574798 RepID=A0A5R9F9Y3_9BACL|nr:1-deoxy-D-xylulose-5-phosphate reductoisomerase [Pseudalkalibacillus caeni]TLS37364.1 1-deoxy-D-xylulose-5-phosphate reductoisomerase [Pseudalkalibacillus caeni]
MKKISLLGATGSIGTQTVDVIASNPESFSLEALSMGRNLEKGLEIINKLSPKLVCVQKKEDAEKLQHDIPAQTKVVYGDTGLIEVATFPDAEVLVNAVIGSVGLAPTLAAIETGKTIALANKETLVTAGHIVMEAASKHNVRILPVDSEHSAIFQCLNGENEKEISRLILTGSGGSFRDRKRSELKNVTIEDALNHPNWSMGAKITIDSATMMNKGLEVIEAHWFFDMPYEKIDVVLHKESIIHSMVEFIDGSVMAHLGNPDMRIPIQYALSFPERLEIKGSKPLNLWEVGKLHFSQVDYERYRCLALAFQAGKEGGTMPTVLNAANEVAVNHFLKGNIEFLAIEELVERSLDEHEAVQNASLEQIVEVDAQTREFVQSLITQRW